MKKSLFVFLAAVFLLISNNSLAKTVRYNFDIDYKTVNFTGKLVKAMAVGGSIPAPTIEAELGDILEVTFNNKMDVETSIHWHGILLENSQDGVPYLTTMPIKAKTSFTYSFPIKHTGTYWYHSHTGLQEQRGVYGALAFYPKNESRQYDKDLVVVLSDWTNENPKQVLANLKKDGDYYALKKDTVQSWSKVIKHDAVKNRLQQSWVRMGAMDLGDIGYDAFLSGGKKVNNLGKVKKGDKIRLRIVNASASTYFYLQYAGGDMQVISADGVDVRPIQVNKIKIAIAETYDVIITVPENGKAYELRATSQDVTGYSSTIIGAGSLVAAPEIPKPILVKTDHSSHNMTAMDHSKMDHSTMSPAEMSAMMGQNSNKKEILAEYSLLKSPTKTTLPKNNPIRTVELNLTGNMERYSWHFNNKTLTESDKIKIKKGENVRFVFKNTTMMNHPLHLHGHFFRVLNGQGDYAPLKHTVSVPAMGEITIEFYANEEKDWFFHCHNLYHMKSGMTRIVSYVGSKTDPKLLEARKNNKNSTDNQWFYRGVMSGSSNMTDGYLRASNTRNMLELEYDSDYKHELNSEITYARNVSRYLDVFAGGKFEKDHDGDRGEEGIVGVKYVLPLLIESKLKLNHEGNLDLELENKLQLTKKISFNWQYETDKEYRFELEHEFNKEISLKANYDSDYNGGIGLTVKF